MVTKKDKDGRTLFLCESCEFFYEDKELAEKCEAWCNEYKSCNLDIIKKAVKKV
jgi:hypothetical protein